MSSQLPEALLKELSDIFSYLENQFTIRCTVIYSIYRIGFGTEYTFSVITWQSPGDTSSHENLLCRSLAARDYLREQLLSERKSSWYCHWIHLSPNKCRQWFSRFKEDPGKFPLADMGIGSDLISPVLYGLEVMKEIRNQAKRFFGDTILEFWQTEAKRRWDEKNKKLREMFEQEHKHRIERKKLLNAHELEEVKNFLTFVSEKHQEYPIQAIVALDGSGRPLGKAIEWFFDGVFPVYYIDPHPLKTLPSCDMPRAAKVLKQELPELYTLWSKDVKSLLFVDDQTGYGNTVRSLQILNQVITNVAPFRLAVLSQYQGDNTPSWLRKRDIQGIKLVLDRLTFLSIENPTPASKDFYATLKTHVVSWKNELTASS